MHTADIIDNFLLLLTFNHPHVSTFEYCLFWCRLEQTSCRCWSRVRSQKRRIRTMKNSQVKVCVYHRSNPQYPVTHVTLLQGFYAQLFVMISICSYVSYAKEKSVSYIISQELDDPIQFNPILFINHFKIPSTGLKCCTENKLKEQ